MSRLLLVRHGQASFMEQDYDKLSATGETQARLLGEYWAERRILFNHVYSGPRRRQLDTAGIAGGADRKARLPWPQTETLKEVEEESGEAVVEGNRAGLGGGRPA